MYYSGSAAAMAGLGIIHASLFCPMMWKVGAQYENCTSGYTSWIQDGYCDTDNNNAECLFDGGDCCDCTLSDINNDLFSSPTCVDPSDPCYSLDAVAVQESCTNGTISSIQDDYCDIQNNNEECLYDGGDCCDCTLSDNGSSIYNETSISSLACVDPSDPCYNLNAVALQTNCTNGYILPIQNGYCNIENNNEGCLYDGGDCCLCTCKDGIYTECGTYGYNCSDPHAIALESFICSEPPPILINCSAELRREWIVENATQARALADAVRCDGETFNVTWKGKIVVDETISIVNGTVLNLAGIESDASIDGNGNVRMFTVVNASLHLRDITLELGYALYGGAIAASRSRIVLDRVVFMANNASYGGGAMFLSIASNAAFWGETTFWKNTALHGGALYMTEGSSSLWKGNTNFSENMARSGNGGALHMNRKSIAVWTEASQFISNSAKGSGGALYMRDSSNAHWTAHSQFNSNSAEEWGGALSIDYDSNAHWAAHSQFNSNSAEGRGGALSIIYDSNAHWTAHSQFISNSAHGRGGALYVYYDSNAIWTADSQFISNSANESGGALDVYYDSNAFWTAASQFRSNSANESGGALYVTYDSSVVWDAESQFIYENDNNASEGLTNESCSGSMSREAKATFFENAATGYGGVLYLGESSTAFWRGASCFDSNSAYSAGGALFVVDGSSVSWAEEAVFSANTATGDGGALYLGTSSNAVWTGTSLFLSNSAQVDGGAVYAIAGGNLSWDNNVLFAENTAQSGGAVFVRDGVTISLSGQANFTSNAARLNGGAVGSRALDSELSTSSAGALEVVSDEMSSITFRSATTFFNNTCEENGGGMALVQSLVVSSNSSNIAFINNSAGLSGGAIFVAATGIGPVFRNVAFIENSAEIGGGVLASGSGTSVTVVNNKQMENPTTFDGCTFIGNVAIATGGAVDSSSGKDAFIGTFFKGNRAVLGGALRLAGTSSVDNCTFIDNVSEPGGGPAVFNVGTMSNKTDIYFNGNVFSCESQTFLDFKESQNEELFEAVCNGCPGTCAGCSFGDVQGSPMCTAVMEHSTSEGGTTTVEGLRIQEGYWRATNTSTNVYKCFNTKACAGGVTGTSTFCRSGYKGPYCSVCRKTYAPGLNFVCEKCSDGTNGIAVTVAIIVLIIAFSLAIFSYMVSVQVGGAGRGIVHRVTRWVPMQSIKIIVVAWQILTQFGSVANVTFPHVYQRLLDGVDFLNFDMSWVFSVGCFLEVNFHDRLLWTTITPVVLICFLGLTYAVAVRKHGRFSEIALRNVRQKHVSMALLVMFLVYSSVSSVVFQMFVCDDLDDGKQYLRADYTITCDSPKHRALQIYASLMIFLYPVGIPTMYACLLLRHRGILQNEKDREESLEVMPMVDLWKPYKPQHFYYEVVECGRRIMLAGVVVFIYPNTAAQIAVTLALAVVAGFVSESIAPYQSKWDAWINRISHVVVLASVYLALLLKIDIFSENTKSQKTFEVVLVAVHGCMILAVIMEAVFMAVSLRAEKHREDPNPRRRHSSKFRVKIEAPLEGDDDGKYEL